MSRLTRPTLAASIAVASSALFMVVLRVLSDVEQSFPEGQLASHTIEHRLSPTHLQRVAYLVLMALLGVVALWRLLPATTSTPSPSAPPPRAAPLLLLVTVFALATSANVFRLGALVGLALFFSARWWSPGFALPRRAALALLALAAVWFVVPLPLPLLTRGLGDLLVVEHHLAMTVLPGVEWAAGAPLLRSNYGLGLQVWTGLISKVVLLFGATPGAAMMWSVRLAQVASAALLVSSARLLNRKRGWWVALLALAVAASLGPLDVSTGFPNQSGLRFLPGFAGLTLLAWASRKRVLPLATLALAGGLLMAWSFELGAAVNAACAVFVVLRARQQTSSPGGLARLAARYVGLFALSFSVSWVLGATLLGLDLREAVAFLLLFSGGYGSESALPSVVSVLLVFIATYALFRGVEAARARRLSRVRAYQAAVGMLMLSWLPYYVNRMREWNLWFHGPLLVMLIAPVVGARAVRLLARRGAPVALTIALTLGGFVGVAVRQLNAQSEAGAALLSERCATVTLSNICALDAGDIALAQAEALATMPTPEHALVFSLLPTQTRLFGFNRDFPWYDPFGEVGREEEAQRLAKWVDEHGPELVVIESGETPPGLAMPERAKHLADLGARLTRYRLTQRAGPWLVFSRAP